MNTHYEIEEENPKIKKEKKKRAANKTEKNTYYVKNVDLLVEIEKWQSSGKMSNELGRMIQKIAEGLSRKPNWSGYTWIQDMRAESVLTVIKYLKNFNPAKSKNPFAYISTIITNSYIGYLNTAKKHSRIKQALFDATVSELDEKGYTKSDYEQIEAYD